MYPSLMGLSVGYIIRFMSVVKGLDDVFIINAEKLSGFNVFCRADFKVSKLSVKKE
ncbi:MAG: hypothetical protein ACOX05_02470 [Bacillota bacterium]